MNCMLIIIDWLKEHEYDGLANPELECSCGIDDFAPCCGDTLECEPAYFDYKRDGWFTDKKEEK